MRSKFRDMVRSLGECFSNIFSKSEKAKKTAACKSIRITTIYFVFGSIWILVTDFLAKMLFKDPSKILLVSIGKGLFYVLVNAVLIYLLIYPPLKKAFSSQEKLEKANDELKKSVDDLRESERSKSVFISHIPGIAYRCNYDREWTMQFISEGCHALTGYSADELIGNRKRSYNDLICEEYREMLWSGWKRAISEKSPFRGEYEITTVSGNKKWVLEMGQPVYKEGGEVEALEGIIIDVDEAKQHYNSLQYMNDHDFLTGLYNRRYFERKKDGADLRDNMPLSIIIADINGVRLINDAFGHAAGDELIRTTGDIIKSCCPGQAVIARTGGDEFGILLPNTSRAGCFDILSAIEEACRAYNGAVEKEERMIKLSLGASIRQSLQQSINEVENEAEDNMYRHKLLNSESHHNAIISSVMATMFARSQETEEHAQRLAQLSKLIGDRMNLPQKCIDDLQLLAMLHDIGKIGIDDRILNKPGKLTKEEWIIMKKHPQIGCRIAMSSPELKTVAEYILCHHERWDGKGYPGGLSGENIPLLSRILAVVDAYDAMTEDRVYRKAMTKPEAIREIQSNAGLQFDPRIVDIFLSVIA